MEELVRHDKAVAGTEAVRYIAAEVQSLLNVDDWVSTVLAGLRDGFQHELHIVVGVGMW